MPSAAAEEESKLPADKPQACETRCFRCRSPLFLAGLFLCGLVFGAHGLFRALVSQALKRQVAEMHLEATRIFLDASEDREKAICTVEARVHEGDSADSKHELKVHDGVCVLRAGSGATVLKMRADQVAYTEATQVRFDMELEHGSIRDAWTELAASQGTAMVSCDMGIAVGLFKTGWKQHMRHTFQTTLPGDTLSALSHLKTTLVREAVHLSHPNLHNLSVAGEARFRAEVVLPGAQAQQLLTFVQGAVVHVRMSVMYAEEDVDSVEAGLVVDGILEHRWEEGEDSTGEDTGPRLVFKLPLRLHGRADLAALAASSAAFVTGEHAKRERAGASDQHFHVQPFRGGGQRHTLAMAARPSSGPLATALGAEHVLSIEHDQDGPTLAEALAKGRNLMERKLAGAPLEGYGVRLGLKLFMDDHFAARADVEVKGGNHANPAVELRAGLMLRISDLVQEYNSWGYTLTGVAFTARALLDFEAPRLSLDMAESLVVTTTGGEESGTRSDGTSLFTGPVWEHDLTQVRGSVYAVLDGPSSAGSFGGLLTAGTLKHVLVGMDGVAYDWTANNPSKDYDPFVLPALTLPPRRLLEELLPPTGRLSKVLGVATEAVKHQMTQSLGNVTEAVRRLSLQLEEQIQDEFTVNLSSYIDFDGLGESSVFEAGAGLQVVGLAEVGFQFSLSSRQTQQDNFTHTALLSLQNQMGVELGQWLAPSVAGGTARDFGSVQLEDSMGMGFRVTARADVVTDLTIADKAAVWGSARILPECSIDPGQESKLDTLAGLGATVAPSDPQCRKCDNSPDWQGWRQMQTGELYSQCASSANNDIQEWGGSSWGASQSCCTFRDETLQSLVTTGGFSMGSEWIRSFDLQDLRRPSDPLDLQGWLSLNGVDLSQLVQLPDDSTQSGYSSTTQGLTTSWIWPTDQGIVQLVETRKPTGGAVFTANMTTDGVLLGTVVVDCTSDTGTWSATGRLDVPNMPEAATEVDIVLSKNALNSRIQHTVDMDLQMGSPMIKILDVTGYWSEEPAIGSGTDYAAQLSIADDKGYVRSGEWTMTDRSGFDGRMYMVLKEDQQEVVSFTLVGTDVPDRVGCEAHLDQAGVRLFNIESAAQRQNGGNLFQAFFNVKYPDDTVLVGGSASFTKTTAAGLLTGGVNVDGESLFSLDGTMPRSGSFFVGDVTVSVSGTSQTISVNASDGYVPSGAKMGLPGFSRAILQVGTDVGGGTTASATLYLEKPPIGEDLSGMGVLVAIKTPEPDASRVETSVDVDLPFPMSDGHGGEIAQEVVQQMTTNIVMDDVLNFDAEVYKSQIAMAAGLSASEVEIESMTYAVDVTYSFGEAVSEQEATTAVAAANGVSESQVTVIITSARRLRTSAPARQLRAVTVDATIRTANAAAVSALSQTSADAAAVAQAVQRVTGTSVPTTVAKAPVQKVEVVTVMHTTTAPAISPEEVSAMGSALGGTAQIGAIQATAQYSLASAPTPGPGPSPSTSSRSAQETLLTTTTEKQQHALIGGSARLQPQTLALGSLLLLWVCS